MKDVFLRNVENFSHFNEVEMRMNEQVVGYSVTAIDKNSMPLGGGTHSDLNIARRIAAAECLERTFVGIIQRKPNKLMTEKYPTTSGFAAGFDRLPTRLRAICEGYERWLWEEWIDRGGYIPEVKIDTSQLSPIARLYCNEFEEVKFYFHEFIAKDAFLLNEKIRFGVVVCSKGYGVFPGSRVVFGDADLWEHALIEAWRHLTIFTHHSEDQYSSVIHKRIFYFGRNRAMALESIPKDKTKDMLTPSISLIREFDTGEEIFIWRSICEGFVGWHQGPVNRFIY